MLRRVFGRADDGAWEPGDVCSVDSGDGTFAIVKVLAFTPGMVHVRLYREHFPERPSAVSTADLSLGTVHDETFGIGHVPLTAATFRSWKPVAHGREALDEGEEMDGFRAWQEHSGGAFGFG